ncbi:17349_t:CDS:2 [Cetraspora pellucida]|uniref:17349_t:CDS:1 n=1 Tax=Cetraspora pellucida TaxID=1433469 RepID=A0A9N8ZFJ8_9GLOM|nr:17349_t:CDS:2 [Cetraspora pellucida]
MNFENSDTNSYENLTLEQDELYNLAPSFAELNLNKYDETNELIHQHVQELWKSDHAFIDDQTKQELNNFLHNYAIIYRYLSPEYINTVKFIKASDLCNKCEQLHANIYIIDNVDNKQKYQAEYNFHCIATIIKFFMTLEPNGLKKKAIIYNNLSFDSLKSLNTIFLKPISLKHQILLFKDIHPYVYDSYKDKLCFAPNENNKNSDSN